jgi:hypothetical protein
MHREYMVIWMTSGQPWSRQSKGAAVAVTMAETDGRGRKNANMVARAPSGSRQMAPSTGSSAHPTITIETSPGHYHYVYVVRDLTWEPGMACSRR